MSFVISVVVPTFNRQSFLPELLDSICQQSLPANMYEAILVDNGSTDETAQIIAEYARRFPHLKYLYEPAPGVSHARNRGLKAAGGYYIGFCDDDCVPPLDWLQKALKIIAFPDPPAMFGGPCRKFASTNATPDWWRDVYENIHFPQPVENAQELPQDFYLMGGNMFLRKDLLLAIGGFDPDFGPKGSQPSYGEDTLIQVKLIESALSRRPYYDPDLFVYHRIRDEKYKLGWNIKWRFKSGLAKHRIFEPGKIPQWRYMVKNFLSLMKSLLIHFFKLPFRDRKRFPHLQNYIFENMLGKFWSLGYLWSQFITKLKQVSPF